ncbi:hypothetical protein LJC48_07605 [Desulfovibrio sp. OttesenSCG-928-C06]|nr:hypothetical protein [Desulfovibrio sp. OttesenSCG-928-C06]
MPINRPSQILGGGATPVVKKARQSVGENRHAMNAALGLDNFSHLLKDNAAASGAMGVSQQSDAIAKQGFGPAMGQNPGTGSLMGMSAQQQLLAQQAQLQQTMMQQGTMQPKAHAAKNLSADHPAVAGLQAIGFSADRDADGNMQNLSKLQKILMQSSNPLAVVNSLNSSRMSGEEAAFLALRTRGHKAGGPGAQGEQLKTAGKTAETADKVVDKAVGTAVDKVVGAVSAAFESGRDGIAAVGYDRTGGTSYGKYQIASKTGTMSQFMNFLNEEAPDLAERLKKAGPANTGGKQGKMPDEWRAIAAEQPERFAELQQAFIGKSHYTPAVERINARTGLEAAELSPAMREAVFSTAVQHGAGGAGRIISRAVESVGVERLRSSDPKEAARAEQEVLRNIYDNRAGQFASSTSQVQASVQNRLRSELDMLLGMTNVSLA